MKSLFGIGIQLVRLASNLPNETKVLLGQFVRLRLNGLVEELGW